MEKKEMKKLGLDELAGVSGGVNVDTIDMDYCSMMAKNYAKRNAGSYLDEMGKYDIMENQYLSYLNTLPDDAAAPKFSTYLINNGYGYWFT